MLHQLLFKGANMINSFDATQETMEEYLRRIHLNDKINMEWNYDQEEEIKKDFKKPIGTV